MFFLILGLRSENFFYRSPYLSSLTFQTVSTPSTLLIPKLKITAPIESVGMNNQGEMAVPQNQWNVAWYNLGPKPGQIGSAVIDGHLDWTTGPAIFWHLSSLTSGDIIQVIDTQNQTKTFTVTKLVSYNNSDFPLQQVFNTNDKARLNLITCAGTFNRSQQNYTKRLVVYSELQ